MSSGIRVNMSEKEAKSGAFTPIPAGWYKATISDGELKESNSDKNKGKPYYNLEFTVSEGEYEGRKVFTNVMLFEGALYSLKQLMAATGHDVEAGELEVPELDEFMGEEIYMRVKIRAETEQYDASNEVRSMRSIKEHEEVMKKQPASAGTAKSGGASILP